MASKDDPARMKSILQNNIDELSKLLPQLALFEERVQQAAGVLSEALLSGHKLLACGNGGSAADASHLTTEFVVRFVNDRRGYPAISLCTHGGDMTAICNDYSFADLFARQVEAFGQRGDVLVAFTTSGKSENVRRALVAAKKVNITSIAFLGRDGGPCAGLANIEFLIRHDVTARIQEAHKILLHTICEIVDRTLVERA
jgi:D-sedoheptulose 7-phosphate isomerase